MSDSTGKQSGGRGNSMQNGGKSSASAAAVTVVGAVIGIVGSFLPGRRCPSPFPGSGPSPSP
jgi:hypothetical protein